MHADLLSDLGLTWRELWLVVITAVAIYASLIALSRVFGQRQFATTSTFDLAFLFAIGTLAGRVILVRTSLLAALVGLSTMFTLHALATQLHHRVSLAHRIMENRAVLVVADGRILTKNLARAQTSTAELYEALRLAGQGSLDGVRAVVLERNGRFSVVGNHQPIDVGMFSEVLGGESLETATNDTTGA